MEALYETPQHMFSREQKNSYFHRPTSVLSSPSAGSSSSSDSQDDLLPELWLETSHSNNYSLQTPAFYAKTSYTSTHVPSANPRVFEELNHAQSSQSHKNSMFHPNFSAGNAPFFNKPTSRHGSYNSPLSLGEESLVYPQSLLPSSNMNSMFNAMYNTHGYGLEANQSQDLVECQQAKSFSSSKFEHQLQEVKQSKRCDSWVTSGKSRHGSASSSSSLTSNSSVLSHSSKSQVKNANVNTQLYKTELCASYMKSRSCPYGSKCQFAHGHAELKEVERPSNWRSKACANWIKTGSCRYGKRCCFKHGE